MDFAIPEEVRQLQVSLKKFLEREVLPLEEKHKDVVAEGRFTPEVLDLGRQIRRRSVELGFYTLHMPETVGGGGLSTLGLSVLREEIAKSGTLLLGLFVIGDPPIGPTVMLADCSEYQREKYLDPLMRGEKTTCYALTEPNAGSDIASMQTSAAKDGNNYILNGTKHFISNGPYCDFAQVFAVTDKKRGIDGGITLFLVDADTPGFTRTLQRSMAEDDLQAELSFQDCVVPAENVVGETGYGFLSAIKSLNAERLIVASNAVGVAEYLLNLGVEYARLRVQFGQPIGKFQAIQWMLADSATEIYAARWMTYHCASLVDRGETAMKEISMAKLFATEMAGRVADRVLQVHGGMGYMKDLPVERLYRLIRLLRIGGGTSEIQRHLIAQALGL